MLHLPLSAWALIVYYFALTIVLIVCLVRANRVPRPSAPETQQAAQPAFIKCHVQHFEYADGHTIVCHTNCEGRARQSDAEAAALHPESPLVHVRNHVHPVQVR